MSAAPVLDRPRAAASEASPDVTVTVVTNDGKTSIVCSPDPVVVKSGHCSMVFKLDTAGYVFREEYAVVVSKPGTDFPRPSSTSPSGTTATLWNRDSEKSSYKYSIFLKDLATGKILFVDPTIENDPP